MRAPIVLTLGLVLALAARGGSADARPTRPAKHDRAKTKQVSTDTAVKRGREAPPRRGQSVGAPWDGRLRQASRFKSGTGYVIRRPERVYGTKTTIAHTRRAIAETRADHPKAHALAIGDFSEASGGRISGHQSHRSGRDVDLGLFFKKQPKGYPDNFVVATEDTLDKVATWRLIVALASTVDEDGGVQIMFLGFKVQGIMYRWAKTNGVSEKRLAQLFQFPHGRGAAAGLIRHEPNHDDHFHVRFRCAAADTGCR